MLTVILKYIAPCNERKRHLFSLYFFAFGLASTITFERTFAKTFDLSQPCDNQFFVSESVLGYHRCIKGGTILPVPESANYIFNSSIYPMKLEETKFGELALFYYVNLANSFTPNFYAAYSLNAKKLIFEWKGRDIASSELVQKFFSSTNKELQRYPKYDLKTGHFVFSNGSSFKPESPFLQSGCVPFKLFVSRFDSKGVKLDSRALIRRTIAPLHYAQKIACENGTPPHWGVYRRVDTIVPQIFEPEPGQYLLVDPRIPVVISVDEEFNSPFIDQSTAYQWIDKETLLSLIKRVEVEGNRKLGNRSKKQQDQLSLESLFTVLPGFVDSKMYELLEKSSNKLQ